MTESLKIDEPCVKCGNEADGIIYIRYQVDGKWGSHKCCQECWDKDNPGRRAVKLRI